MEYHGKHPLDQLVAAHPQIWQEVRSKVARDLKLNRYDAIAKNLQEIGKPALSPHVKTFEKNFDVSTIKDPARVRSLMTFYLVDSYKRRIFNETGKPSSAPSRWDSIISQRIFFTKSGQRKIPSKLLSQWWWRSVRDKANVLMHLQSLGIYCVYSRELCSGLARRMRGRKCLEVGAGDGTLSLALESLGIDVRPTDDHSWNGKIQYPTWVENLDARSALRKYSPEIVICSWPPPNNNFEREIFSTASVSQYFVLASKHQFAVGDWQAYTNSKNWTMTEDASLTRLCFPPEQENCVIVFRRNEE
jgi:hypothetical protein